jgi:hypothetical protein
MNTTQYWRAVAVTCGVGALGALGACGTSYQDASKVDPNLNIQFPDGSALDAGIEAQADGTTDASARVNLLFPNGFDPRQCAAIAVTGGPNVYATNIANTERCRFCIPPGTPQTPPVRLLIKLADQIWPFKLPKKMHYEVNIVQSAGNTTSASKLWAYLANQQDDKESVGFQGLPFPFSLGSHKHKLTPEWIATVNERTKTTFELEVLEARPDDCFDLSDLGIFEE